MARGKYNFFQNNKEKYNSLVFVIENYKFYDMFFYIDPDFSSGQWAYTIFLTNKSSAINMNRGDGYVASAENMNDYSVYFKSLNYSKAILAIDPTRYLETNCKADQFIKDYVITKKVNIYPSFNINTWNKNCP
jgi:hypothetical protein